MVEGIDNAGIPDTEDGEEAANEVSDWADSASTTSRRRRTRSTTRRTRSRSRSSSSPERRGTIAAVLASGVQTIAEVARLDTELAAAFVDSSTCQQLREETG